MTRSLVLGIPVFSGNCLHCHDLLMFLHPECPLSIERKECLTFCDHQTTCINLFHSVAPLQVSRHICPSASLSQRKLPGLQREITPCNFVNLGAYQFPEALNRGQFSPYVPKCTLFPASFLVIVRTVIKYFPDVIGR